MFGSQILDTALGLAFVLMMVSLICSAIREGLEGWLKTRATHLEHGVRELLHDGAGVGIAKALFEHPLIAGLYSGSYAGGKSARPYSGMPMMLRSGGNLPSYIPSRSFALAIMDIAARGPITDELSGHPDAGELSLENVRASILNIGNPAVQRVLLAAVDSARGDFNQAVANVEKWYDGSMDRVSGWYKRSTQWILFAIGLAVAAGGNINTITIADKLFHDTALRAAVVARAERASEAGAPPATADLADLRAMKLPIGWDPNPSAGNVFVLILGWLVTAFAATLGAPFWFDVLNKIMVIRSTVKPHEKSPEEASEDRQKPPAPPSPPDQTASAGPAPAALVNPASAPRPTTVMDANSRIDGCDIPFTDDDATADEDLPPAEGGVV